MRSFWWEEFAAKPARWQEEAVAPIQNKAVQFLSIPLLRTIVGQAPGLIDLRQIMDRQQILIVNLSKGRIGEAASTLLGLLLAIGLQQAAMRRSDAGRTAAAGGGVVSLASHQFRAVFLSVANLSPLRGR